MNHGKPPFKIDIQPEDIFCCLFSADTLFAVISFLRVQIMIENILAARVCREACETLF